MLAARWFALGCWDLRRANKKPITLRNHVYVILKLNQIPPDFVQASIKFTNEPPLGIKAGLKRTYAAITQDFLDINNMMQWKPILYGVSFLHTVVQVRLLNVGGI